MSIKRLKEFFNSFVNSKNNSEKPKLSSRRKAIKLSGLLGASTLLAVEPLISDRNDAFAAKLQTLTFDLIIDGSTFVNQAGDGTQTIENSKRSQSFVIKGKLYKGNTISPTADPSTSNSIGVWNSWGIFNFSGNKAFDEGIEPPLLSTQYLQFDNGDELVTIGGEFFSPTSKRSIVGGVGALTGANGTLESQLLSKNSTGWPNFRLTLKFTLPKIKT